MKPEMTRIISIICPGCGTETRYLLTGMGGNDTRACTCYNSGTKNPNAKLTDAQVYDIRALRANGQSLKFIARMFDISLGMVSRIARRIYWAHLPNNPVAASEVEK